MGTRLFLSSELFLETFHVPKTLSIRSIAFEDTQRPFPSSTKVRVQKNNSIRLEQNVVCLAALRAAPGIPPTPLGNGDGRGKTTASERRSPPRKSRGGSAARLSAQYDSASGASPS